MSAQDPRTKGSSSDEAGAAPRRVQAALEPGGAGNTAKLLSVHDTAGTIMKCAGYKRDRVPGEAAGPFATLHILLVIQKSISPHQSARIRGIAHSVRTAKVVHKGEREPVQSNLSTCRAHRDGPTPV